MRPDGFHNETGRTSSVANQGKEGLPAPDQRTVTSSHTAVSLSLAELTASTSAEAETPEPGEIPHESNKDESGCVLSPRCPDLPGEHTPQHSTKIATAMGALLAAYESQPFPLLEEDFTMRIPDEELRKVPDTPKTGNARPQNHPMTDQATIDPRAMLVAPPRPSPGLLGSDAAAVAHVSSVSMIEKQNESQSANQIRKQH